MKFPEVVAAVRPKEGKEGVPISKTERPVLQSVSRPVLRGALPGRDTPELSGPSVGLSETLVLLGASRR